MLQTDIEGKKTHFGHIKEQIMNHGYVFGGNWDYDRGSFDNILWRQEGETIYVRIPFQVVEGALDNLDAYIEFETPYVIKHVVNIGLDKDENSLLTATGFNQFQDPIDTDGNIQDKSKWEKAATSSVQEVMKYII